LVCFTLGVGFFDDVGDGWHVGGNRAAARYRAAAAESETARPVGDINRLATPRSAAAGATGAGLCADGFQQFVGFIDPLGVGARERGSLHGLRGAAFVHAVEVLLRQFVVEHARGLAGVHAVGCGSPRAVVALLEHTRTVVVVAETRMLIVERLGV